MSVLSQFIRPTPGNLTHDPQRMVWNVIKDDEGGIGYFNAGSTVFSCNFFADAATWTALAISGDVGTIIADQDDPTADAGYVTVTNITDGSGVLTNLILPGGTADGDTVSVKVTADGAEWELEFELDNAEDRFCSGKVIQQLSNNQIGESQAIWDSEATTEGLVYRHVGRSVLANGQPMLCTPGVTMAECPCLRFETSLKVEMASSDFDTTDNRDECAVIYTLDQY